MCVWGGGGKKNRKKVSMVYIRFRKLDVYRYFQHRKIKDKSTDDTL